MKKLFTCILAVIGINLSAQQTYCDFEGTKNVSLAEWNGVMDSVHINPSPNSVNSSSLCAKYIRDTALYDNFKFFPYTKLSDITPYASSGATQKITLKVLTSSPVGTQIDIQLGSRTSTTYPTGVHSTYTAVTSVQNAWETLTFNFMSVSGSTLLPTDIDKIVVFVRPNSHTRDTIYFDDPTGPPEAIIGIKENTSATRSFNLYQNIPNPSPGKSEIKYQLNSAGHIKLNVYDILGREICTLVNGEKNEGIHSVTFETSDLPAGVYFYTLKKEGNSKTIKMIVTK
jgi:hypothetical protein